MIKNIKNISVLVSICVVITVLLAATNAITAPIIEKNQNASANAALLEVMPNGSGFEKVDISGYSLPSTVVLRSVRPICEIADSSTSKSNIEYNAFLSFPAESLPFTRKSAIMLSPSKKK